MLRAHCLYPSIVLLIAFAALLAAKSAAAAEPSGESAVPADAGNDDGVLVLDDGGVLRGKVTHSGDRYVVVGAKSRVEVAASNVAVTCNSLTEAYDVQRRQLPHDTAEAHLGLADWCLRCQLLSQAGGELEAARRLDPHSAKLELLQRRLAVATQSASPRQASDDVASGKEPQPTAEAVQLEAIAAELPAGAVERFTRKVQPLLVNNCTTAGCHQVGGPQVFQLDRAVLHGLSNRRTTLSNLVATLALVKRDAPQLSPLLTIPRTEHAGMKQPLMGSRQDQQFRQLEEWVGVVTGTPAPLDSQQEKGRVASDSGSKRSATASHYIKPNANKTVRNVPSLFHLDEAQAAKPVETPSADSAASSPPSTQSSSDLVQTSDDEPLPFAQLRQRKRPTTALTTWEPKDAFDPEIFNRQHSQAGTAAGSSSHSAEAAPTH
ncbi:MAG TPA: hypothetical protein VGM76_01640 [Lacipirellulaceae bacterium]|jgi:hypothetical protein